MSRRTRRRFPTRRWLSRQKPIVAVLVVVALVALRVYQKSTEPPAPPEALSEGIHEVGRVVDGDTFRLTNNAPIRLIGADTPETQPPRVPKDRPAPWGPEATEFTEQFLAAGGNRVRLQFDRERIDKYKRFLAYVWVGDKMLNEELIRQGLAWAKTDYNYSTSKKTLFRRAEEEARIARRGLWSGTDGRQ